MVGILLQFGVADAAGIKGVAGIKGMAVPLIMGDWEKEISGLKK